MSPDPLRANKYHSHITPGPSHVCSETLDKTVSFACICTHGPVLANHIHNQENICSHTHQLLLFCPLQVVTELMALRVHQSISGCGVVAVELIVSYNKTWLVGAYVAQGAAVMCTNSWYAVAFVSICSNTHAHTHTYIHVYILIFLKGIDDGSTQTQLTYSVAGLLVCAEKALHNQGTETNQTRDRKAKPRHNCRNPLLPNPMYPELMSTPSTTPANTFLIFCAPADRCCSIIAAQKWKEKFMQVMQVIYGEFHFAMTSVTARVSSTTATCTRAAMHINCQVCEPASMTVWYFSLILYTL